jgi:hypothetical protein
MRQPATGRFKSIPGFIKNPVLLIAAGAALNFTKNYKPRIRPTIDAKFNFILKESISRLKRLGL